MTIRIMLADDHAIVCQGLKLLLATQPDFEIIGETGNGRTAVEMAESLQPDVCIVDLMMPGLPGLEVARRLTEKYSQMKVIILSLHEAEQYVMQSIKNGASGYVLKEDSSEEIIQAVRSVIQGKLYLSKQLNRESILSQISQQGQAPSHTPYELLNQTEKELLCRAVKGQSDDEIAHALAILPSAMKVYKERILRKVSSQRWEELINAARGDFQPDSRIS